MVIPDGQVLRGAATEGCASMKRLFLIITLLAFGPLGISAISTPAAMAAQVKPATTAPSNWDCNLNADIPKSGTNGGLPVFLVTYDGCLDGIHKCDVVGTYDTTLQAVECMDIYVEPAGSEKVRVAAAAEGYCQSTANNQVNLVQCANVDIPFELYSPNVGHGLAYDVCGHSAGSCDNPAASPGHNAEIGVGSLSPATCNAAGSGNEYWAVDLAGGAIELPGDHTITISANEASPHAIICA